MQTITIADTGRSTSRLGFGCSSIMGALSHAESLAVLETAVEAGITHFDVAPSYGYGQAEACLGELLRRHPGKLTVTTKYGIAPARNPSFVSFARNLARPLIKHIPALKQRLNAVAGAVVTREAQPNFSAKEARLSLERSLSQLKTGSIDLWLLHEATAESLHDEALLRLLEDAVAEGRIGTFGVGSEGARIPALLASRAAFCRVVQYEWSVLDAPIPPGGPFRIHHRALTANFRDLHGALLADPAACGRWSTGVGHDLAQPETLANLMLKASLVANPRSIILFSSKNPEHIRRNVRVAEDASLEAPALSLHHLVREEGSAMLQQGAS